MKIFNTTLLLLIFAMNIQAQTDGKYSITGKIMDEDAAPLTGANVFLTDSLEHVVQNVMCDEEGAFRMERLNAGSFVLKVSHIGHIPLERPLTLDKDVDLGVISMSRRSGELQTVIIQGRTTEIKMQKDGFSVDVTRISELYNNAFDLMRSIPQVSVVGDKIKVLGKSHVVVKVGGVVQRVEESQLARVLQTYDARLIERVEVLQRPPLRYDRDGQTAMIILHTSQRFRNYAGGDVGSELMQGKHGIHRYGGFGSVMYNSDKLFFTIAPAYNHNGDYHHEQVHYDYGDYQFHTVTPSKGDNSYKELMSTLQWNYSRHGLAGITATMDKRSIDNAFLSTERFTPDAFAENDAKSDNTVDIRQPKHKATLYMEQSLGKEHKHKLWLETSYYNFKESDLIRYASTRLHDEGPFFTYTDDDRLHTLGTGMTGDYSMPLGQGDNMILDFGARYLFSRTTKQRAHTGWMDQTPEETYSLNDRFGLDEQTVAPYASFGFQVNQRLAWRVGLIMDITSRKARSGTEADGSRTMLSWLPSLQASYTRGQRHLYYLTLNSSVTQPKYGQLNPFVWRANQKYYSRGNKDLLPETHYNGRLGYVYKGSLSFVGTASFGHDVIANVTTIDEAGRINSRPENAQNSTHLGAEVSYWFNRLSWLTVSASMQGQFARYTSDHPLLDDKTTGFEWGGNVYTQFVFNSQRTLTGYVSGNFTGQKRTAVSVVRPVCDFEVMLSWALLDRNLNISLGGMGLFASSYRGYSRHDGYTIRFHNRYTYPKLYFSINYRFFNAKNAAVRRKMSSSDAERRF